MDRAIRRKLKKNLNKKKRKKKRSPRLPKKLIIIPNMDKKFHEKWESGRDALNIIHPFRICCMGPPNSGKSLVVKNIVIRCKPEFERVIVIHGLGDSTLEYDDVEPECIVSDIPSIEFFLEVDCKTLVILDDIDFKALNKDKMHVLNRLYGTLSTHKQISCILCSQDFFQLPPIIKRCSNFFILWRPCELSGVSRMAEKAGIKAKELNSLFDRYCHNKHDSVWIDNTNSTPYPIRINGYKMVNEKSKEK